MGLDHWITVRIIQGLWLTVSAYWLIRAFNNKTTVYRQSLPAQLSYALPLIFAFMIISHGSWRNIPLLSVSPGQRIIGVVLCAGGIAFAIWARTILGKNWSGIATVKKDHALICRGPYAVVRHPIYTGLLLAYTGTALALWPTTGGLTMLAAFILAAWIKSIQEEKLMQRQFPEAYPAYRQRVRGGIIPRYWVSISKQQGSSRQR